MQTVTRVGNDLYLIESYVSESPSRLPLDANWAELETRSSESAWHISLHGSAHGDRELASVMLIPAEALAPSVLPALADRAARSNTCVLSGLRLRASNESRLATLLYLAARRARILGRANLVAACRDLNDAGCKLLNFVSLGQTRAVEGGAADWTVAWQRLDRAMHAAWNALAEPIPPAVLVDEVRITTERWIEGKQRWGFFRAVERGTLTRHQYVYALSNMYQFVRHTTRILGRCVSLCEDPVARKHFVEHLQGEVNHEIIIERDLAHLGEDVAYVIDYMVPNVGTTDFMAIQESRIGYYEDVVSLLASPLAAEGVTSHLGEDFLSQLIACVRSWGVERPEAATKFFTSHVRTDGGDDGHWEGTLRFLASRIQDEHRLRQFLRANECSRLAVARMLDAYVSELSVLASPANPPEQMAAAPSA